MRCSVLDLGSNSFHVLVADLDGTTLVPVEREREMLHLGRVVARHGGLPEADVVRAEETVAHLTALARRSGTDEHLAVATSALRDADNGPEVLARLDGRRGDAGPGPVRRRGGAPRLPRGPRGRGARGRAGRWCSTSAVGRSSWPSGAGAEVAWSASTPLGVSRLSTLVGDDPAQQARRQGAARRGRRRDRTAGRRRCAGAAPVTTVAVGGTVRALARVVAAEDAVWLPTTLNQLRRPDRRARPGPRRTARPRRRRPRRGPRDEGTPRRPPPHRRRRPRGSLERLERRRGDRQRLGPARGPAARRPRRHGPAGRRRAASRRGRPAAAQLPDRRPPPRPRRRRWPTSCSTPSATSTGWATTARELLGHAARLHDVGETLALRRHPVHGAYLVDQRRAARVRIRARPRSSPPSSASTARAGSTPPTRRSPRCPTTTRTRHAGCCRCCSSPTGSTGPATARPARSRWSGTVTA